MVGFITVGVFATLLLTLNAFQQNLLFFLTPTQIVEGRAPAGRAFRMGGVVADGSLTRLDGIRIRFEVTDFAHAVTVEHAGILPDLFREGQGVVVRGFLREAIFYAEEVLAKHDENYIPLEVHDALEAAKTLRSGE